MIVTELRLYAARSIFSGFSGLSGACSSRPTFSGYGLVRVEFGWSLAPIKKSTTSTSMTASTARNNVIQLTIRLDAGFQLKENTAIMAIFQLQTSPPKRSPQIGATLCICTSYVAVEVFHTGE